jgi:hypothetical protein
MTTPEKIARLRRLHEAAPASCDIYPSVADTFYEAAHEALPELLDEVERLRAAVDAHDLRPDE